MPKTKVYITAQVSKCIGEVDADTYVEYLNKAEDLWKKLGYPAIRNASKEEMLIQPTTVDKMDGWTWEGLREAFKRLKQKEKDDQKN